MGSDSGRDGPGLLAMLPNVLLSFVLVILLLWGVAGLYVPEDATSSDSQGSVLTTDTVPKPVDSLVPGAE